MALESAAAPDANPTPGAAPSERPVALVTGGNRGIGLGISRRLIQEGYNVSILATREEPARSWTPCANSPGTRRPCVTCAAPWPIRRTIVATWRMPWPPGVAWTSW